MKDEKLNIYFDYIKLLTIVSLFIWIVYQLSHVNNNFWFFSYSNLINDSIGILVLLIITLTAYFFSVKFVIFCFKLWYNKDYHANYFITLLILYIFLYIYLNNKTSAEDIILQNNFIVDVLDAIWVISIKVLLFLLSFFILQINYYHLYYWYFKKKIMFDNLWHSINICSLILIIPVTILIVSETSLELIKIFMILLISFLWFWNYNTSDNHLDYNRLLSKWWVYGIIWVVIFSAIISIGAWDNLNHNNICFNDNNWNIVRVEYMNDNYIFTKDWNEIYKNNIEKFVKCKN